MSKNRIKANRKMIRAVRRRKMAAGVMVALLTAGILGIANAHAGTPDDGQQYTLETDVEVEPIENQAGLDAHILEETRSEITPGQQAKPEARTYDDVPFVALPVDMAEPDQEVVFSICQDGNVAFPLVMAIIEHESQFDATARSTTGDSGLMQINDINKATLYDLGYTDLFLLEDNVGAGVYMLSDLFGKYPGETTFVLMAYNAGEKGAREMVAQGIHETEYSREIMERAEVFTEYIDAALDY